MYACTLTEGGAAGTGEQGRVVQHVSHSASALTGLGSPALALSSKPKPGISPAVMMVSKHVDGSLNQVREEILELGMHHFYYPSALVIAVVKSLMFSIGHSSFFGNNISGTFRGNFFKFATKCQFEMACHIHMLIVAFFLLFIYLF